NTIERAILLEDKDEIQAVNLMLGNDMVNAVCQPASSAAPAETAENLALAVSERDNIIAALKKSLWIQKDAALLLGVSPRVLNHKIKKMGITHPRWRKFRS
ncbi:hypothetical protein MNBD_DELTA03-130, partial [hydrothermal vent metagenome]